MGHACISSLARSRVAPPNSGKKLQSAKVREILTAAFRITDDYTLKVSDRDYLAYSIDKLREFLRADWTDKLKYKSEVFDCDDFARVLQGREREWFGRHTMGAYGSTFGTIWGDLRADEQTTKPYPHAMNFFVDDQEQVWIIEPQSDAIRKFTSNSAAWIVIV